MVLFQLNRFVSFLSTLIVLFALLTKLSLSLSIFEVVEKVVNNSPELRVIFEKKNQALADYKEATSSYLPTFSMLFSREYVKRDPITSAGSSSFVGVNKFQLLVDQKIFDMEQVSRILKFSQGIQTSEFENQKLLEEIVRLAISSYYDIIQAEYLVTIYTEYLRQVKEVERITLDMRQQGSANLGDVNFVQSRLASANSNLLLYQANLDRSQLKLAYLLNLIDKDQQVEVAGVVPTLDSKDFYELGDKIISLIPLTAESLLSQIANNNLDLLVSRSALCEAAYDLEVQKARYLPTVDLASELKSEENRDLSGYDRSMSLSVKTKYTLYDGGSRNANNKKFASILKEAQYQYDILARDLSEQAYTALNQLKSSEQQRISILKEIEASEELDRVYNIQFQFASRTLTDRLDNLERLSNARAKLVQMDYSILNTRIEILSMMGFLIDFFGFQNYIEVSRLKLC